MMDHYLEKDKSTADELNSFLKVVNQKHLPSVVSVTVSLFYFTDQTLP